MRNLFPAPAGHIRCSCGLVFVPRKQEFIGFQETETDLLALANCRACGSTRAIVIWSEPDEIVTDAVATETAEGMAA